jgi:zinc D-Ala-D-Ala carboxypeptidase
MILKKDLDIPICIGLSSKEARCNCENEFCRSTVIDDRFVVAYEKFRILIGMPLKINSLYRCVAHNFKVGGKSLSRHTIGEGVDISLKSLDHLSKDDITFAAKKCGFTFILFYDTFVHIDVRKI